MNPEPIHPTPNNSQPNPTPASEPEPAAQAPAPAPEPQAAPASQLPGPADNTPAAQVVTQGTGPSNGNNSGVPWLSSYTSNPYALIIPGLKAMLLNWKGWLGLLLFSLPGLISSAVLLYGTIVSLISVASPNYSVIFTPTAITAVIIASLILIITSAILSPAAYVLTLATARGEKMGPVKAVKRGFPFILRIILLQLVMGIIFFGGLLLFIIPGLIFIAWYALSPYFMVAEGKGVRASLKASKALVKGRFWEMWGLLLVSGSIYIFANFGSALAVLSEIMGLFLAISLVPATAMRYYQLKEARAAGSLPPVSRWNYLAIGLGLVGSLPGSEAPAGSENSTQQAI